jgi:hypothetical protein
MTLNHFRALKPGTTVYITGGRYTGRYGVTHNCSQFPHDADPFVVVRLHDGQIFRNCVCFADTLELSNRHDDPRYNPVR